LGFSHLGLLPQLGSSASSFEGHFLVGLMKTSRQISSHTALSMNADFPNPLSYIILTVKGTSWTFFVVPSDIWRSLFSLLIAHAYPFSQHPRVFVPRFLVKLSSYILGRQTMDRLRFAFVCFAKMSSAIFYSHLSFRIFMSCLALETSGEVFMLAAVFFDLGQEIYPLAPIIDARMFKFGLCVLSIFILPNGAKKKIWGIGPTAPSANSKHVYERPRSLQVRLRQPHEGCQFLQRL